MDARAERAIPSAGRAAAIHRRPGAFRAPDPLGAGQSHDPPGGVDRGAGPASSPTLVGLSLHEGVRPGRCGTRSLAAIAAGISLAAGVRAPLDELRAGHRTDLSGGEWRLRRTLSRPRASIVNPASAGGGLVQERGPGEGRLLPHGAAVQSGADPDPAAL